MFEKEQVWKGNKAWVLFKLHVVLHPLSLM